MALQAALYSEQDPNSISLQGQFASAWIAVSGVDSPNDIYSLNKALSPIFNLPLGNRLQITNDANLLASPLNSHPELDHAVAVIAGTGSVVITFSKSVSENSGPAPLKEMARVGGWGWILGDLGSGFEIGKEAVRDILARADILSVQGQVATSTSDPQSLQSRILAHFGITLVHDLFGVIYAPDPLPTMNGAADTDRRHSTTLLVRERRLSQLSPLVFEAAFKHGDEVALAVVRRCANAFAQLIASTLRPASGECVQAPLFLKWYRLRHIIYIYIVTSQDTEQSCRSIQIYPLFRRFLIKCRTIPEFDMRRIAKVWTCISSR